MRNRCLITVTDYRGSRHFTLTQLVRRILAGSAALLALVFLSGSVMIHFLSSRVSDLNTQMAELSQEQEQIQSDKDRLMGEKVRLSQSVDEKSEGLHLLGDELERIESIIGLESSPEDPLPRRVDTASQTALEKRLMLESIPSGHPVEERGITSSFGERHHPVHGNQSFHGGVDLRAPRGEAVHATADGVVQWASRHGESGMGKMVELVHNFGFTTVYGHLDEIEVEVGEYISKGDLLGTAGSTGVATAPHLHYEVRYLQRRLNPDTFLDWSMEEYELVFEREDRVQWQSLAEAVRRTAHAPERQWSQLEPALSVSSF